jgi:hypothetical protein
VKTKGQSRLIIPAAGIASSTASTDSVLVTKTDGFTLGKIAKTSLYPTWQQTLTAGSTLTGDNTIAGGGFNFTWNNANSWQIYGVDDMVIGTTNGGLNNNQFGSLTGGVIMSSSRTSTSHSSLISVESDTIRINPNQGLITIDTLLNDVGTKSMRYNPITKLVSYADTTTGGGISGLTTNELVYGNSATTIASLPVATYPSLTELSYVKGLTSSAQTQINAKQATLPTFPSYYVLYGNGTNVPNATNAFFQYDSATNLLSFVNGDYLATIGFGTSTTPYSSIGELKGGAGFYMGTGVMSAPTTANSLIKTNAISSKGNFFYTRYDRGLEFHTGITANAATVFADTDSLRAVFNNDGTFNVAGNTFIGSNTTAPTTKLQVGGRFAAQQGADVASAAGAIALGTDGNSFEITGTAAITLISNSGWVNGSEVTLLFTSTATLTDGTANSGTDIGMELAGNTNFTASAGATLTLILSEIGGTQRFREKCRSVN